MSDQPIRFAVVGLGMGRHHCKDLQDAEGAELIAVCDVLESRRDSAAEEFGVKTYAEYDEMLKNPDIDIINVCVPSGKHSEFTIKAAQAGKHVVCEKPPDITVPPIDAMIDACRSANVKLLVIFQSRFSPLTRKMKEAIESGRLGKLVGVHANVHWWRGQGYYDSDEPVLAWKGTWGLDGGGSMSNQGVHTVDLVQWLAGQVEEVYGYYGVYTHEIEAEDKTAMVMKFRDGHIGTLSTTTSAYPGIGDDLMIHGEKGSIQVKDGNLSRWVIENEDKDAEKAEEAQMMATYGPKDQRDESVANDPFAFSWRGHLLMFEDMVGAIREDRDPINTGESARHAVEIINALYESCRQGKPIKLNPKY